MTTIRSANYQRKAPPPEVDFHTPQPRLPQKLQSSIEKNVYYAIGTCEDPDIHECYFYDLENARFLVEAMDSLDPGVYCIYRIESLEDLPTED